MKSREISSVRASRKRPKSCVFFFFREILAFLKHFIKKHLFLDLFYLRATILIVFT